MGLITEGHSHRPCNFHGTRKGVITVSWSHSPCNLSKMRVVVVVIVPAIYLG